LPKYRIELSLYFSSRERAGRILALNGLVDLGDCVYLKLARPAEDAGLFLNTFSSSLGYIVGILTGILGLKSV
jgi:hypothetical protein